VLVGGAYFGPAVGRSISEWAVPEVFSGSPKLIGKVPILSGTHGGTFSGEKSLEYHLVRNAWPSANTRLGAATLEIDGGSTLACPIQNSTFFTIYIFEFLEESTSMMMMMVLFCLSKRTPLALLNGLGFKRYTSYYSCSLA
jgi:hypothetical protein